MGKEYIERWEACKDCIHFDVCAIVRKNGEDRVLKNSPCKYFKNKADVAEVRHGKWIDTETFDNHYTPIYQCSECWKEVADNYISNHKNCLHCGTKMDGEAK